MVRRNEFQFRLSIILQFVVCSSAFPGPETSLIPKSTTPQDQLIKPFDDIAPGNGQDAFIESLPTSRGGGGGDGKNYFTSSENNNNYLGFPDRKTYTNAVYTSSEQFTSEPLNSTTPETFEAVPLPESSFTQNKVESTNVITSFNYLSPSPLTTSPRSTSIMPTDLSADISKTNYEVTYSVSQSDSSPEQQLISFENYSEPIYSKITVSSEEVNSNDRNSSDGDGENLFQVLPSVKPEPTPTSLQESSSISSYSFPSQTTISLFGSGSEDFSMKQLVFATTSKQHYLGSSTDIIRKAIATTYPFEIENPTFQSSFSSLDSEPNIESTLPYSETTSKNVGSSLEQQISSTLKNAQDNLYLLNITPGSTTSAEEVNYESISSTNPTSNNCSGTPTICSSTIDHRSFISSNYTSQQKHDIWLMNKPQKIDSNETSYGKITSTSKTYSNNQNLIDFNTIIKEKSNLDYTVENKYFTSIILPQNSIPPFEDTRTSILAPFYMPQSSTSDTSTHSISAHSTPYATTENTEKPTELTPTSKQEAFSLSTTASYSENSSGVITSNRSNEIVLNERKIWTDKTDSIVTTALPIPSRSSSSKPVNLSDPTEKALYPFEYTSSQKLVDHWISTNKPYNDSSTSESITLERYSNYSSESLKNADRELFPTTSVRYVTDNPSTSLADLVADLVSRLGRKIPLTWSTLKRGNSTSDSLSHYAILNEVNLPVNAISGSNLKKPIHWFKNTTPSSNTNSPNDVSDSDVKKIFWFWRPSTTRYTTTTTRRPSSTEADDAGNYDNVNHADSTDDYTSDVTTDSDKTTLPLEAAEVPRFSVYWNVPTFQCHKYGLNFSQVSEWGIEQNFRDEFRGEAIAILYDPGEFPALLSASGGNRVSRNGGVPQEASLTRHLSLFAGHIDKLIPDAQFHGLGVIDFEHWRPIWRQNWGSLAVYRDYSRHIEKRRHPFWFSTMIEMEAKFKYELAARTFILETLRMAKRLRPMAKWGYYGYPFCFNYTPNNNRATCSYETARENDAMSWMFNEVTAHYPSLYLKESGMHTWKRRRFVEGRLDEALRVAKNVPVYPYIWYKYHDSRKFLSYDDMREVLRKPLLRGCRGVVIWGASKDVNTREKCNDLARYLDEVIGPMVAEIHSGVRLDLQEEATTVLQEQEDEDEDNDDEDEEEDED